jgi:ABC-2 type transport system ATP-binding protein
MRCDGSDNVVPVVECRELTKAYRSRWKGPSATVLALDKVSFRARAGTIIGLIGPNGAGKTTFLSLIAGLIHPTQGEVRIGGHRPRSIEAKRHLGYVPESPAFLPRYSARAVLRYHAALHGLSRTEVDSEAERLLEQVKLHECAGRAVGGFSLGMKQRLALAVALIGKPRLLLLDEPSNGLDPIGVIELRRVLSASKESGATVIVSSHRLGELERLTSDYVFLDKGRIVQFDKDTGNQLERCLRIDCLSGGQRVKAQTLAPHRLLDACETRLMVAVSGVEDVPEVIDRSVQAGVRITAVSLETEDIEDAFVRLVQERSA